MRRLAALLLALLAPAGSWAKDGGNGSHGGGAFICSDPGRNELVDLWEARVPGLVVPQGLPFASPLAGSPADPFEEELVREHLADLARMVPAEMRSTLAEAYSLVRSRRRPRTIHDFFHDQITDRFSKLRKPGCELVAAARYSDAQELLVYDAPVVMALPRRDRAALWVHETVYKALRMIEKADESTSTRRIVGVLFSTLPRREARGLIRSAIKDARLAAERWGFFGAAPGRIYTTGYYWQGTEYMDWSVVGDPDDALGCRSMKFELESRRDHDPTRRWTLSLGERVRRDPPRYGRRDSPYPAMTVSVRALEDVATCHYWVIVRDWRGEVSVLGDIDLANPESRTDIFYR
jgi:hypothetical protein